MSKALQLYNLCRNKACFASQFQKFRNITDIGLDSDGDQMVESCNLVLTCKDRGGGITLCNVLWCNLQFPQNMNLLQKERL